MRKYNDHNSYSSDKNAQILSAVPLRRVMPLFPGQIKYLQVSGIAPQAASGKTGRKKKKKKEKRGKTNTKNNAKLLAVNPFPAEEFVSLMQHLQNIG